MRFGKGWLAFWLLVVAACSPGEDGTPGAGMDAGGASSGGDSGVPASGGSHAGSHGTEGGSAAEAGGGGIASGNEPPTVPELSSPADGALDVPAETALCWSESSDPEGDPIRYRVFLDELELATGKVGQEGFAGPCTDALALNPGRLYEWRVLAFDPAVPALMSASSETWSFTTAAGDTQIVFEDDFTDDKGWEVLGDAASGAWIRGDPTIALLDAELAQPEDCHAGTSCYFTGQNPDTDPDDADVDDGTTVLLSPPFDLDEASSVSVSLARFFFLEDRTSFGNQLVVELLVPDEDAPDGFQAHVLESLDSSSAEAQNAWTTTSYGACAIPLVAGARLRISATDLTGGIVEAGIDSVMVLAYTESDVCQPGPGALCDPEDPSLCGEELLCCLEGAIHQGIYRCTEPERAIDPTNPPAAPGDALNGELGCPGPDITPRMQMDDLYVEEVSFEADDCEVLEGCVEGLGLRRLLRFDMRTQNVGSRPLVLGPPANHPELFVPDSCHDHYHFESFARYRLLDADGADVARGRKQAQCVWDWGSWAWSEPGESLFHCYDQGLQVGWEDEYAADLYCQWIDITDVAPGDYTLRIELNTPDEQTAVPRLVERNYDNNVAEFAVTVPPP